MITNQVIERAVREVLETTAMAPVNRVHPGGGIDADYSGIVAMLGLGGGGNAGTLLLFCQWAVASSLAARMMGMGADEIDGEMVQDAMGELLNQIGGTVKRQVRGDGDLILSVPSVVSGEPVCLKVLTNETPISVDVDVEPGTVHVRYCVPSSHRH